MPTRTRTMLVKNQDKVWHNPSLDQMIEALQVVMMTNGPLAPIPVEYNAYILHLIEGFNGIQQKLGVSNSACDEVRSTHDKLSVDFEAVTDEWARREARYKTEIRRLEVLLARTSYDGLETVTLARANSIVDREEPNPTQFISRLRGFRSEASRQASNLEPESPTDHPTVMGHSALRDVDTPRLPEWSAGTRWAPPGDARLKPKGTLVFANGGRSTWRAVIAQADNILVPLPNILDEDKDFLASERIRRDQCFEGPSKVQHRPRPPALRPIHLARYSASEHPRPTANPTKTRRLCESIQYIVESDSSPPSSDSGGDSEVISRNAILRGDGHRRRPLPEADHTTTVDGVRGDPWLPGGVQAQRGDEGTLQIGLPPDRSQFLVGITSRHNGNRSDRFSFVPGDDSSPSQAWHACSGGTSLKADQETRPWRPDQVLRDRLDSGLGSQSLPDTISGLAAPEYAQRESGWESGMKPTLQSNDSAGTIETVILAGDRKDPVVHIRGDARSENAATQDRSDGSSPNMDSSRKPGAGRASPSRRQQNQGQDNSQIAAFQAPGMKQMRQV